MAVLHIQSDDQAHIFVLHVQSGDQPHILYILFFLEKGEICTTSDSLLSRSRSKVEELESIPVPVGFVDAERICLLNGAAAFLERKLFRHALENCEMVRALISCIMPVGRIGLKYVSDGSIFQSCSLTTNLKPTDYENLFNFVLFHGECNSLITILHVPQKHIVLNRYFSSLIGD
jgi:hypothetical protein